jgi:hypothetical protein
MASTSSSSSSLSSSSSGEVQSAYALLEGIEAAILAVSNNQSYRLGDRTVTRADLMDLMKVRHQLKIEINAGSGVNPRVSYADMGGF